MLLVTVSTFYLAQQNRFAAAGAAAFLATLTRAQSVVLVVPLLIIVWRRFGARWWHDRRALSSVLAAPAAVVAYQVYLIAAGLPRADEVYRNLWKSVPTVPGYELWLAIQHVATGSPTIGRRLALVVFFVAAALTVLAFKRLPPEYGAYMLTMIILILTRHDQLGRPLLSFSRHALMLFPGLIALAATVR